MFEDHFQGVAEQTASDLKGKNVILIAGETGGGRTALAHKIAEALYDKGRLYVTDVEFVDDDTRDTRKANKPHGVEMESNFILKGGIGAARGKLTALIAAGHFVFVTGPQENIDVLSKELGDTAYRVDVRLPTTPELVDIMKRRAKDENVEFGTDAQAAASRVLEFFAREKPPIMFRGSKKGLVPRDAAVLLGYAQYEANTALRQKVAPGDDLTGVFSQLTKVEPAKVITADHIIHAAFYRLQDEGRDVQVKFAKAFLNGPQGGTGHKPVTA